MLWICLGQHPCLCSSVLIDESPSVNRVSHLSCPICNIITINLIIHYNKRPWSHSQELALRCGKMGAESVMLTHPVSFSLHCKGTGLLRVPVSHFVHFNFTFVQKLFRALQTLFKYFSKALQAQKRGVATRAFRLSACIR